MALFKISKGLEANLPETKTPGYCWYTTDSSFFYVDFEDENGEVQRKALNSKDAETLCGASLETILNNSEAEIPTSSAIFVALAEKSDVGHTHSYESLTDKPFGNVITEGETVIPETSFSGTSTNILDLDYALPKFTDITQVVIEFDGQLYTQEECNSTYAGGEDMLWYGNGGLYSYTGAEDNGLPFLVYYTTNSREQRYIRTATDGEHTIKAYVPAAGVKTIDEIYIPDTISRTDHNHSYNDLLDKPFYEEGEVIELLSTEFTGASVEHTPALSLEKGKIYT